MGWSAELKRVAKSEMLGRACAGPRQLTRGSIQTLRPKASMSVFSELECPWRQMKIPYIHSANPQAIPPNQGQSEKEKKKCNASRRDVEISSLKL